MTAPSALVAILLSLDTVPTRTVATKLVGSQLIAGSSFGEVVDVDGGVMAIGAPDHYVPPDARGSVYIFVRSGETWSEHSRLFASDGQLGDEFGAAVALSGDTLLVGAPSRDGPSGEFEGGAYVFTRGANGIWAQQVKLLPPGVGGPDRFGERVALSGGLAVVLSGSSSSSGFSVFPYARNGQGQWIQEPPFEPPFQVQDVGLVGTTLVVTGAPAGEAARAAVYERAGGAWVLDAVLAGGESGFAARQTFDGDTLAVSSFSFLSAPELRAFGRDSESGWIQQQVAPIEVGAQATLGAAMAVHGDRLAVGLLNDPTDEFDAALMFVRDDQDSWQLEAKLVPPDYPRDNGFGISLSTDGVTLAIGANEVDQSAGAVFVESLAPSEPGTVPPSLVMSRASSGAVTLTWGPSCGSGNDYEVYAGALGDFASHAPLFCTTDGATSKTFVPAPGDAYYLVVPRTAAREGSYGRTSAGSERPPATASCSPRESSACD